MHWCSTDHKQSDGAFTQINHGNITESFIKWKQDNTTEFHLNTEKLLLML